MCVQTFASTPLAGLSLALLVAAGLTGCSEDKDSPNTEASGGGDTAVSTAGSPAREGGAGATNADDGISAGGTASASAGTTASNGNVTPPASASGMSTASTASTDATIDDATTQGGASGSSEGNLNAGGTPGEDDTASGGAESDINTDADASAGGKGDAGPDEASNTAGDSGVANNDDADASDVVAEEVTFPDDLPDDDGIGHFHHVHINAMNPMASVEFYTTWFNSEAAELGGQPALWTQASWILFKQVEIPAPSDIISSIYHIGWTVFDMDETYDAMIEAGVSFDTPRTDISTVFGGGGGIDFAYVDGPDHELTELYQARNDDFNHLHFVSDDPVSSGEWYQEHFGAERDQPSPSREPGFVNDRQIDPWMSVDIDAIGVLWYPTGFAEASYPDAWEGRTELVAQRGRAIDHFALSVDNLPQALERLESEGVELLEPPAWRENGSFISAFIQGPDQVEVEIVQGHANRE